MWKICGMKRLQKALRDVKRREAGMQKSQCFQGFSARYEKIREVEAARYKKRQEDTRSRPNFKKFTGREHGLRIIFG